MTKNQLVDLVSWRFKDLSRKDVDTIVSVFFDSMADFLTRGDRIEIRGFGAFVVKARDARTGHNPVSGKPIPVPRKRVPLFSSGKNLRERVNR